MTYERLILRYYLDGGVKKELRLPFCNITSPNISNQINTSTYRGASKYYSTMTKTLNRSYPITISGVLVDDMSVRDELLPMIPEEEFKTVDEYITALNNLESIVNFSFKPRTGTIVIRSIYVDSVGITRQFRIEGTNLC